MTADDLHARADCARRNPVVLRDGKPVVTITCDHADALADLIDAAREVERLAALRGFRGGALADALAALEADQIVTGGEESGAVTPSAPASFPAPDPSGDTLESATPEVDPEAPSSPPAGPDPVDQFAADCWSGQANGSQGMMRDWIRRQVDEGRITVHAVPVPPPDPHEDIARELHAAEWPNHSWTPGFGYCARIVDAVRRMDLRRGDQPDQTTTKALGEES